MPPAVPQVPLGTGIYPRPDAARLLGMKPERIRRWVGGYTYWLRQSTAAARRRRHQGPVVQTELPIISRMVALSFLELMELRVVKALVEKGLSLQHVRRAAQLASSRFETRHPFASRRVFTDGRNIFSSLSAEPSPDVVKWSGPEIDQVIAGPVFEHFLAEIEFDSATALAERWWPLGRAVPVVLDPRVSFGAPVVAGTAIRTNALARMARVSSVRDAAIAFEVDLAHAQAAAEFEVFLATA